MNVVFNVGLQGTPGETVQNSSAEAHGDGGDTQTASEEKGTLSVADVDNDSVTSINIETNIEEDTLSRISSIQGVCSGAPHSCC